MSQGELAGRLGMSPGAPGQFPRGDTLLTGDLSQALDRVTGIPANIWNGLEAYHRRDLARLDAASRPVRTALR